MITFRDLHNFRVDLSFEPNKFDIEAKHVLVVVKKEDKWLMTKHPKRGIEFPGGKVEAEESLEQAAIRETLEETNVLIEDIEWLGEYKVYDVEPFCKAIMIGRVKTINDAVVSHETEGVVWLTDEEWQMNDMLSFHMRDIGMQTILERVKENEAKWND